LTPEIINARAYQMEDRGDSRGWRINFSILLEAENIIIHFNGKGITPEQVWEMVGGYATNKLK
jgi:hypothetical protein